MVLVCVHWSSKDDSWIIEMNSAKIKREKYIVLILALVAQGLTDQQIADELKLARKTVSRYLTVVRRRTGIRSRTLLGFYALGKGLVTQQEIKAAIEREKKVSNHASLVKV